MTAYEFKDGVLVEYEPKFSSFDGTYRAEDYKPVPIDDVYFAIVETAVVESQDAASWGDDGMPTKVDEVLDAHVPALIAECKRLRGIVEGGWQLMAPVEVERILRARGVRCMYLSEGKVVALNHRGEPLEAPSLLELVEQMGWDGWAAP